MFELTIVSIFFNRKDSVAESVESVIQQLKPNWQLILVDDGSTDGTLNALRRYESSNVIVKGGRNIGLTNRLIQEFNESNSPFIALHGSGDVSLPGRFEKQISLLKSDEAIGFVSCYYKKEDPNRDVLSIHHPSMVERKGIKRPEGLSHGEIMYRKSAYEKAGGYNSFFVVGQGSPLWFRIIQSGYSLSVVREILYLQKLFKNGVSKDPDRLSLQKLLFAIDQDMLDVQRSTGIDLFQYYGIHAPSFLSSKRNFSKALFLALIRETLSAQKSKTLAKINLNRTVSSNATGIWWIASMIFIYTPFKEKIFLNRLVFPILKKRHPSL
jgi:glycosyltransferase involved in cell wall biosynthesis